MRTRSTYRLTLLLFLLMGCLQTFAQDCYTKGRDNGIAAYNKGDYNEALKHFDFALNVCDDAPADNDITNWIQKCNRMQEEANRSQSSGMQRSSPVIEKKYDPLVLQSIYDNMVYVDGGTFMMGSNDNDAYDDEQPVHRVTINSFRISRYVVTAKQWEEVMGSIPYGHAFSGDNYPITCVDWHNVQTFINKLNQLTGRTYRLPTEAEWEFAARGGNSSNGYKYAGGNILKNLAWYGANSENTLHLIGQKQANELGLYDMSGNVWEWCQDWYGSYPSAEQINPKGPSTGSERVYRGGGWKNSTGNCCVSLRNRRTPNYSRDSLGFRLCM